MHAFSVYQTLTGLMVGLFSPGCICMDIDVLPVCVLTVDNNTR